MKKLLLTLIVALAFCGSIFAQTTHWPEFNNDMFEDNSTIIAFVTIDGEYVAHTDNWAELEVSSFVAGEPRGANFMASYPDDGDPYAILESFVAFTSEGETVTFQMYDHAQGILYVDCTTNFEVITGVDHNELYIDYDAALVINFTSPAAADYRRTVTGYGESAGGYVLLASPINGIAPANVTNLVTENAGDYDLYAFDQNPTDGDEWRNFKANAFTTLESGKGYLYARKETAELVFAGTPYSGDGQFDLVYSGGEFPGMNLMGNPFTVEAYSDQPYYTLNDEGEFVSNATTVAIPAMHGVFVCAEGEGEKVTFSTEGTKKVSHLALNLVSSSKLVDRAIVNFGEGQLPKFQLNANSTKLYFPMSDKDYAVVSCQDMGELPLNFKAQKSGSYTLAVNSQDVSFAYLHLIDNLNGSDTDLLANPSYSFEASSADYASRFKLVFATGDNTSDEFAFFSNGAFVINNDGNATLQVVDVTGRVIMSESINGCANVSVNAAPGVYMIRLVNGDSEKVQKVIVK